MIYNRIPVKIGESRRITTRPTNYKYDEVQILMISPTDGVELPDFYQVDFCVEGDTDTVTMAGTLSGGVPIPDGLLRQGQNLEAYLVVTASGNPTPVQTRWTITIPVNERPTRSGIELSDDQQAQVNSLIAALNEGVDKAEDAADAIENMGAEAETLPEGSEASVTKTVDPETGVVTLTFGIPKGAHGDPGYSPTIMIATITGGHRITVTDSQGSASFDVMDGEQGDPGTPGDDGYSPAVTITQITGGHRVTITDKTHQSGQTFDVMDGEQGDPGTPGDDGYSPAVTITTITGGHRVTITDKTHPSGQSFDVMDGASDAGQVSYDPTQTYQAGTVGAELSNQKNAISEIEDTVNDPKHGLAQKAPLIINTASGDIASFPDGADGMPVKSLVASIEPAQDLHGYEYPWPAGGGKNKCRIDAYTVQKPTWYNGGWYAPTIPYDGGITQYRSWENGGAGGVVVDTLPAGTYTFSLETENTTDDIRCGVYYTTDGTDIQDIAASATSMSDSGKNRSLTFTLPANSGLALRPTIYSFESGQTSVTFKNLQIEAGSTATYYTPYANECPISGHTGLTVTSTGKNLFCAVDGDCTGSVPNTTLVCADGIYTLANATQYPLGVTTLITGDRVALALGDNRFVKPGTYAYSLEATNLIGTTAINSSQLVLIDDVTGASIGVDNGRSAVITNPATITEIKCSLAGGFPKDASISFRVQLERSSAVTEYERYTETPIPITWETEAGTIYKGTATYNGDGTWNVLSEYAFFDEWSVLAAGAVNNDGTGRIFYRDYSSLSKFVFDAEYKVISNKLQALDGQYAWEDIPSNSFLRSLNSYLVICTGNPDDTSATMQTWAEDVQLLMRLKTPVSHTITTEQLFNTLYGYNNIWTDVGDVSVDYPADTKLYIDNKIAEAIAAL